MRSIVLAVSLLALAACHSPEAAAPKADAQARAVNVVTVEPRVLAGTLSASGPLIPREEAAVAPEVTGYRVSRVLVEEGAYVRRGQTLAQLDPALIEAQVAQQAAQAQQAQVQAERAQAEAARVQGLDTQGVLSKEDVQGRQFAARAARATAAAQQAALRDLRTRAAKLAVTAPVAGLVLERTVRPGDLAAGGATPWFRIARDGQIELEAQLAEADLARVRAGQAVTVELTGGATVQGTIRLIDPSINPETQLGAVRVSLPPHPQVRSGGFARANFASGVNPVLAVPESAIRYDADGASVMVVGADNRVRQVAVKTGARGGGFVELVSGPAAGSRVLQRAASLVLPGDVVKPVQAAPAAAAPAAKVASQPAAKR
ncbi:efflux RND transporter periplasmic adaptor subunit [Phenylobacterium sp.]|jgi:HlyD family secretion protein|uniref:efflux RND transporter periplasmic adaptor subunit n=1 Tax=Phenylobacterium sp. TaxID=1871053 RepID=UPI002E357F17|nr:efflux RND transporter periplasmic adaptor subunit [Phenylobacterium sp.]HEX2558677.1 efflux RND transporter periplasmic adaptor subunit [Phenylobacterium sp.]